MEKETKAIEEKIEEVVETKGRPSS